MGKIVLPDGTTPEPAPIAGPGADKDVMLAKMDVAVESLRTFRTFLETTAKIAASVEKMREWDRKAEIAEKRLEEARMKWQTTRANAALEAERLRLLGEAQAPAIELINDVLAQLSSVADADAKEKLRDAAVRMLDRLVAIRSSER